MWVVVILQLCLHSAFTWDPDAGLVRSYTKASMTKITATSHMEDLNQTVDGDTQSHWTSKGCLPGFYYSNPDTNALLQACAVPGTCTTSNVDGSPALDVLTDGDTYTAENLVAASDASGSPSLEIKLPKPQQLLYINVRGKYDTGTTYMRLYNQDTELYAFSLSEADNYDAAPHKVPVNGSVSRIVLEFTSSLKLWEIDAIGENGCMESITYDFGEEKEVGEVKTRHWAGGGGLKTQLFCSLDNKTWTLLADLNPEALGSVTTIISNPVRARFIKVSHTHNFKDYTKVYMWEVDAYDGNGEYGPPPAAKRNPNTLRSMLGVNGIWGWGNGKSSPNLAPGQGAALYAPVASHARNYHNLGWDVTDPDVSANYDQMAAGHGTESKSWVNWDTEYAEWRKANLSVDVSIQFSSDDFPPSVWDSPDTSAHRIGEEFAKHFGPTYGTGAATAAEVGNEPWNYDASFYNEILRNMAKGFKDGDPQLIVMPGAFQADNDHDTNNYIGTRVTEDIAPYIDVVNFHHYSFLTRDDGVRITTYPEHPATVFNSLRNIVRWRDANMPGKPIWVTEWGWDSPGGGQDDCNFSECVSEDAAATYATRGLMIHARSGVERSTWFFYANTDCNNHVFCRSGLTGNIDVSFAKKQTYIGLQGLLDVIGHVGFLDVLHEDHQAYVYAFGYTEEGSGNNMITHIVAWRPVDIDADTSSSTVTVGVFATPLEAFCQDSTGFPSCSDRLPTSSGDTMTLEITPRPMVVRVQESLIDTVVVG